MIIKPKFSPVIFIAIFACMWVAHARPDLSGLNLIPLVVRFAVRINRTSRMFHALIGIAIFLQAMLVTGVIHYEYGDDHQDDEELKEFMTVGITYALSKVFCYTAIFYAPLSRCIIPLAFLIISKLHALVVGSDQLMANYPIWYLRHARTWISSAFVALIPLSFDYHWLQSHLGSNRHTRKYFARELTLGCGKPH